MLFPMFYRSPPDEGQAPAGQESQASAPAPSGDPAPETPAPEGESSAGASGAGARIIPKPVEPPTPKEDWRDKRISVLTARAKNLETEKAQLAAALAQKPGETDSAFDARVEQAASQKAQQIAQQSKFIEDCNAEARVGRASFPDFDTRIGELTKLIDKADPVSVGAYQQFVATALETGEGAKLLHMLGGDLNEAARIMSLPASRQGIELAKLAVKAPPEPVTAAPAPIRPIGNRGTTHEQISPDDKDRSDSLNTRAWMERRNEQVAEAAKRRYGR